MNNIVDSTLKLRRSDWLNDPGLQVIFDALHDESSTTTRAVGGAVRDTVQGRKVQDVDLATELKPEDVLARAEKAGLKTVETGFEHGTVTVISDNMAYEITTLRSDIQTDGRHAKVLFGVDWAQDAMRRDFTMNALYCDRFGVLLDPISGLDDAVSQKVRFIGDPDERICEDILRIFRYFRFVATRGQSITDKNTVEACSRATNAIDMISKERIGREMIKLLHAPRCASVLSVMTDYGLLDKDIFTKNAINRMILLENVYESLNQPVSIFARLALLGDMTGVELTTLKAAWRLPSNLITRAIKVQDVAKFARSSDVRHFAYRAGDLAQDAIVVAEILSMRPNAQVLSSYLSELKLLDTPVCPIRGEDLIAMGYQPSPGFGSLLLEIENLWVSSGFTLSRDALLRQLLGRSEQLTKTHQYTEEYIEAGDARKPA